MRVHHVSQGSAEWLSLRAGVPTSSHFDRILTPTGKVSTQAEKYQHELLAERLTVESTVDFLSEWMVRGKLLEPHAAAWYASQTALPCTEVGFMTTDDGKIGASPDRLVGDDGLLEIKCPKPATHIEYLLGAGHAARYKPQVQGQLWISGRAWVDVLSYHPKMKPALVRVERDEDFIAMLSRVVTEFVAQLDALEAQVRAA